MTETANTSASDPCSLPLPKSSRVDNVIHISDVHIPFIKQLPSDITSTSSNFTITYAGMQRIQQFREAISSLIDAVWERPAVKQGRAVVLLAGDLFDCKHAANAVTVKLLHDLVTGLCTGGGKKKGVSDLLPVYVIAGNHDIHMDIISEEEENVADNDDRLDLLGTLLAPLRERYPVAYISRTGVFGTPGSGALFGVLHVKDAMQPGNCSGHARAVEHIPTQHLRLATRGEEEEAGGDMRIFVYHGQVSGHRITSSHGVFIDEKGTGGIPVPYVAEMLGYDACMLGDVHTMQLHNMTYVGTGAVQDEDGEEEEDDGRDTVALGRFSWDVRANEVVDNNDPKARKRRMKTAASVGANNSIPWAYSGSLLQLNAGERLFPHGFLSWDLRSRYVDAFHVRSDVGIFFCSLNADKSAVRVHNALSPICDTGNPSSLELSVVHPHPNKPSWLPRKAVVRMVTNGPVTTRAAEEMRDALSRAGVEAVGGSTNVARNATADTTDRAVVVPDSEHHATSSGGGGDDIQCIDLSRFGLPDAWVEYISNCFFSDATGPIYTAKLDSWKERLYRPESTIVSTPPDDVPESVKHKIFDRNSKIMKRCTDWRQAAQALALRDVAAGGGGSKFRMISFRWSWLLCFANDNVFDFSSVRGKVALLSAPNGAGKSSALEVLCIALFGQPMPSRGSKSNLADALCRNRPSETTPGTCSVDLELEGNGFFRVSRSFSWSSATNRVSSGARVSRLVPPHDTLVTVKDGITGVNTWVTQHLGTLSDFLLSTLLTQDSDSDFFAMKPADQRALLDNAMALDSARVMTDVLKDARLAHSSVLDSMNTVIETSDQSMMKNIPRDMLSDDDQTTDGIDLYERFLQVLRTIEGTSRQKEIEIENARQRLQEFRTLVALVKSHLDDDDDDANDEEEKEEEEEDEDAQNRRTHNMIREFPSAARAVAEHLNRQIECEITQWRKRGAEPARWVQLWETGRLSDSSLLAEDEDDKDEGGDEESREASGTLASLRDAKLHAEREHRVKLDAAHAASARLISASTGAGDEEVNAIRAEERRLVEQSALASERLAEARKRKEAAVTKLNDSAAPTSEHNILASLRGVERMYERAKDDMMRYKDCRAAADTARARKEDAENAAARAASYPTHDVHGKETEGFPDVFDDDWFDTWQERRKFALETAKTRYHALSEEEDEEIGEQRGGGRAEAAVYDRAHACARRAVDACGRLLREAILAMASTSTTNMPKKDEGDEEYDAACAICMKRRDEDERRFRDRGIVLSRLRECASKILCRSSRRSETREETKKDEDGDGSLALISDVSGALASAHRWLREWEDGAYSISCGSTDVYDKRRKQLTHRVLVQAARAASESETLEKTAQEAQIAARASKSDYQEARDAHERLRCTKENVVNARIEAEREYEDAFQRMEFLWTAIDDVRDKNERLRAHRTAKAQETSHEAEEAGRLLESVIEELDRSSAAAAAAASSSSSSHVSCADMYRSFMSTVEQSWNPWKKECEKGKSQLLAWKARARHVLRRLEDRVDSICRGIYNSETDFTKLLTAISRAHVAVDACKQWRDARARWKGYRDEIEDAKTTLEELSSAMGGFTSWVYTHRALPALVVEVNALLRTMNSGVRLDGSCKPEDAASLSWTLNSAPVYKSSGMQRFVASLAMRIALAQLGACSHSCRQLVIDEGFVALDGYHIAHVPEFLHEGIIATGRFESVLLVSHLEGVKDAADVVVPIMRDRASATSRLCFPRS